MKPARLDIRYKPANGRVVRIRRTGTASALLDALLEIAKHIVQPARVKTSRRKRTR